jgi:hypothetical protein
MKPRKQEITRRTPPDSDYDLVIASCAEGVWIVVYAGEPFQIRKEHHFKDEKKYLPNAWSQRGSAERAARTLNQLFQTDQFEIAQILGKTTL